MLTMGSLFDGIGGFPLAGLQHDIEPVWASEIEEFPIKVTKEHFLNMEHLGDITKINGSKITPVDIICGGFPCQDLSLAGKREGFQGERSVLFFDAARIIEEMLIATDYEYPKAVIIENVPGLLSSNDGKDMEAVLDTMQELGFLIDVNILDAQYMGVPQRRRRVFLVCLNTRYLLKHPINITINTIYQLLTECLMINHEGLVNNRNGLITDIKTKLNKKTLSFPSLQMPEDLQKILSGELETTDDNILFCSNLLLTLGENILQHPYLPVAELILAEIRRCMEYARQTSGDLFTDMEWVHNWNDYLKRASSCAEQLERHIRRQCPVEIFPESDSLSRDTEAGGEERKDTPADVGTSSTEASSTKEGSVIYPWGDDDRLGGWVDREDRIFAFQSDKRRSTAQEHIYHKPNGKTDSLTHQKQHIILCTQKTLMSCGGFSNYSEDTITATQRASIAKQADVDLVIESRPPEDVVGEANKQLYAIFDPYNNNLSEKCTSLGTNCGMSTGRSIVLRETTGTLRANAGAPKHESDWESLVLEKSTTEQTVFAKQRISEHNQSDKSFTLIIEPRSQDGVCRIHTNGIVPTLNTAQGGQRQPCVLAFAANQRDEVRDLGDKTAALQARPGMKQQTFIAQPSVFAICADHSNSMKSKNPNSGIYLAETTRTLDMNGGNPACNQGGMAIVEPMKDCTPEGISGTVTCKWAKGSGGPSGNEYGNLIIKPYSIQGSMIGRQDKNGPQGDGINEDVSFTLNATDRHAVAYRESSFGQYAEGVATLKASGGVLGGGSETFIEQEYAVRRLTPLETERLQGFPDNWTASGSDTARYQATGNSVAIPVVSFILKQVADILRECVSSI